MEKLIKYKSSKMNSSMFQEECSPLTKIVEEDYNGKESRANHNRNTMTELVDGC